MFDLGLIGTECGREQAVLFGTINSFCVIGVNLFWLVSGYFGIRFKWEKWLSLFLQVTVVYGIVTVAGMLLGKVPATSENIIKIFKATDIYWYIGTYLILMLVSPALNVIADWMDKHRYRMFLLGFMVICCGYGFFMDANLHIANGYSLLMAIMLYLVGRGIMRFSIGRGGYNFGIYIGAAVLNSIIVSILYLQEQNDAAWHMFMYNNPLIVIEAVSCFLGFKELKLSCQSEIMQKIIALMGKSTIMVYLLHSTCWLETLRGLPIYWVNAHFGYLAMMVSIPIFAVCWCIGCSIVNVIYEHTLGKVVSRIMRKIDSGIW